jgi:hypothetical protein
VGLDLARLVSARVDLSPEQRAQLYQHHLQLRQKKQAEASSAAAAVSPI